MAEEEIKEEVVDEDRGDVVVEEEEDDIVDLETEEEPVDEEEPEEDKVDEEEAETDEEEEGERETPMIPKPRFDEKNNELKAIKDENQFLRDQLNKLNSPKDEPDEPEAKGPSPEEVRKELNEKRKEMMAAIADGDFDIAIELEEEINAIREQQYEAKARTYAKDAVSEYQQTRERQEADTVSEKILADHPELTQDKDLLEEFRYHQSFAAYKGMSLVDSLREAEKRIFGQAPKPKAKPKKDESKEVAEDRKKEAVSRNLKAEQDQPPRLDKGAGERGTQARRRVKDLSDEEFEKLSDAEKKQMRGD